MIDISSVSAAPEMFLTTSQLAASDRWDHFLARIGYKRSEHRLEPGLYALGKPTPDSRVFVTANYTLSFDALRAALDGMDGYILVLDTQGINVWCAAGKGTFGTDEIVHRVFAPGVAAHEVKKRTGFKVEYGPVRAAELPEYLKTHKATPEMRRVQFTLRDRATLIPVEFVHVILPTLIVAIILYFTGGIVSSLAAVTAVLAGTVLFPILLPWLPTNNFSTKGFILGGLAALPFALSVFLRHPDWSWYLQLGQALGFLLAMPAVTAFLTLNFTGSTTFTSRTGVRREMFAYIPAMAWTFAAGIVLNLVFVFVR